MHVEFVQPTLAGRRDRYGRSGEPINMRLLPMLCRDAFAFIAIRGLGSADRSPAAAFAPI